MDKDKTHYIYRIDDIKTGQFYIGSRSCYGSAEDDHSYMGSMVAWKPNMENLRKTIIKSDFRTRESAIKMEIRLIKENINNPLNENYNIPGEGFHNTGRIFGDETRKKMSESRKGDKNPRWGNPHSEETKEKIRQKAIGRKLSLEIRMRWSDIRPKKPVIQYDKQMNKLNEYAGIKIAGRTTKVDIGDIIRVCQGKQKSAGGYIWKYKNTNP
jgi:hypothetical protein